MTAIAVALAAGGGAVARWLLDAAVQRRELRPFPAGILVVNLTGSLALGFVAGLGLYHGLGAHARAVAGTGFVGGYTTFSTFAVDTVRLAGDGFRRLAVLNVVTGVAGGVVAATAGLALAGLV